MSDNGKLEFTYRNLAEIVYGDFAVSTNELVAQLEGSTAPKVREALHRYPSVFCGDMEEDEGGVRDANRTGRRAGRFTNIIWQVYKTYDDHELQEVFDDLVAHGAQLDAIIR